MSNCTLCDKQPRAGSAPVADFCTDCIEDFRAALSDDYCPHCCTPCDGGCREPRAMARLIDMGAVR